MNSRGHDVPISRSKDGSAMRLLAKTAGQRASAGEDLTRVKQTAENHR